MSRVPAWKWLFWIVTLPLVIVFLVVFGIIGLALTLVTLVCEASIHPMESLRDWYGKMIT